MITLAHNIIYKHVTISMSSLFISSLVQLFVWDMLSYVSGKYSNLLSLLKRRCRVTLSPYLPLCFPTTAGAYVRVYTSFSPAFSVMESLPLRSRPSMVTSSVISSGVGFLTMTSSTAFFCKVRKQSVTDMNTKNTYLISKYEFDILNQKLNKVWPVLQHITCVQKLNTSVEKKTHKSNTCFDSFLPGNSTRQPWSSQVDWAWHGSPGSTTPCNHSTSYSPHPPHRGFHHHHCQPHCNRNINLNVITISTSM